MDYNKITIRINPFEEWLRDVLTAQLGEIGYDSFLETETGFEAYIPAARYHEDNLFEVIKSFEEDFTFEVGNEIIKSQNWNEVWEKNYFKPLLINNECVVRAPFHTDYPKAKYEIIIEPNMAFGTGNHETTTMMIETILENDMENRIILDMGCGTGILGILASMKGAKKVTAIDIDEWSYTGAKENARLNQIENMKVKLGDASLLGDEKYDIIFANIHKNVLINDMPAYSKVLQQGGLLVVCGFYTEDMPDIKVKAEMLGLNDNGFKSQNNWVAYRFKKH
jgi:ribosomal protein L11 methyltransferase